MVGNKNQMTTNSILFFFLFKFSTNFNWIFFGSKHNKVCHWGTISFGKKIWVKYLCNLYWLILIASSQVPTILIYTDIDHKKLSSGHIDTMVTLFRPQDMVIPLLPKLLVKESTQTCGGLKSHSMIPNIQMKPKLTIKNTKLLLDNKCFNIFLCYYLLFSSTTFFLSIADNLVILALLLPICKQVWT